ncbi:DUF2793 domain-containing protein [Stakelama sp. CBK3Z-3]|uniref:DUF2793 domain-containing protein n=1 Tax=Stakelama flava TaxID=2860338 RepID=A0ABS6XMD9_9SPHN|nr:DUF2793 domain-containing protein [Stakelama flava]MBW4330571.1 DUF2793 domain-containing protein [Stakelama flava]
MSEDVTERLGLPLLWAGQAQKEIFHNEALTLIDLSVQPDVVAVGTIQPPVDPSPGDAWIVGMGASGDWEGRDTMLAGWTGGGWRFIAPRPGMTVWSIADTGFAVFRDEQWRVGEIDGRRLIIDGTQVVAAQQPAIANPENGEIIDTEARNVLNAILYAIRAHGLIAS